MIDTHCHLNFSSFKKDIPQVIYRANKEGVTHFIVPGTDIKNSKKAATISYNYKNVYASVGIHPHHVYKLFKNRGEKDYRNETIKEIEQLLCENENIVAIGEIGLDAYSYVVTKYDDYQVNDAFLSFQEDMFVSQLMLAKRYKKSVIIHNREMTKRILILLQKHWDVFFEGRMVFHCCEANNELLEFAKNHKIFIGIDGDITYGKEKKKFVKNIPLDLLVLETDSPLLLPEPLRSRKSYPNEPRNLRIICDVISHELNIKASYLDKVTTQNAKILFRLPKEKG